MKVAERLLTQTEQPLEKTAIHAWFLVKEHYAAAQNVDNSDLFLTKHRV
jgi:hypothetical protein